MQPVALSIPNRIGSLSQWFETPLGAYLLQREHQFFDNEVADLFGFNALQFGLPEHEFLRANRMPLRATVAVDGPVKLRGDICDLPIATASVDLVVLPHTLEFSQNPHQVLREVQRVLRPEGRVVLSGFNPWSLWGVARRFGADADVYPWCGQFISLPRIKDWMALLGFEVAAGRMAAYRPPCQGEKWLRRLQFMELAGDRWWPFAGGVYFLHAVKRVHGMRLITPKWKMAANKKKALAAVPHCVGDASAILRSVAANDERFEAR